MIFDTKREKYRPGAWSFHPYGKKKAARQTSDVIPLILPASCIAVQTKITRLCSFPFCDTA
jgi:hypothetical protein